MTIDFTKILGSKDTASVVEQLSGLHEVTLNVDSYVTASNEATVFETTDGLANTYINSMHPLEMQSDEDEERLKDDFVLMLMKGSGSSATTLSLDDIKNGAVVEGLDFMGICLDKLTPETAAQYLERFLPIEKCVIRDNGSNMYGYFKTGDVYGTVQLNVFTDIKTNEFSKYKVMINAGCLTGDAASASSNSFIAQFNEEYDNAETIEGVVYKR